jgi:hypothetical protein
MPADSHKKLDVLLVVFLAVLLGGLAMLFVRYQSRGAAVSVANEDQKEGGTGVRAVPLTASVAPPKPEPPKAVVAPPKPVSPPHFHRVAPAHGLPGGSVAGAVAPPPPPPPPVEDDATKLDKALANLKPGNLAYSTPTQMKMAETQHVVAKIATAAVSVDTLKAALPTDAGAQVATATTSITPKMKMMLSSGDFTITPLSSEEQLVAGSVPTTWEWDIVPKHSGELQLHLAATIELNGLQKDFTTVDREIAVKVDPADEIGDFVKANWQWLIATLTALVGAVWRFFSGKKKETAVA